MVHENQNSLKFRCKHLNLKGLKSVEKLLNFYQKNLNKGGKDKKRYVVRKKEHRLLNFARDK